jgi:ribosomal protein S18 acetylase RimI-like enzyme
MLLPVSRLNPFQAALRFFSRSQSYLDNSLYSVAVVADGIVVGMGRVIGDGLYYYIQDLIVHPDFQGKGIGRKIMDMDAPKCGTHTLKEYFNDLNNESKF